MSTAQRPTSQRPHAPRLSVHRLARGAGLSTAKVLRALRVAAGKMPIDALTVAIVDDAEMSRLHLQFMGEDSPTDVLTFDLRDDRRTARIDGEIVVSLDTARREARQRGLDVKDELLRYVVHGVLHLTGMDDHTADERRKMRRAENAVLRELSDKPAANRRTATRNRS